MMNVMMTQSDFPRLYGECILYWLLENAWDGRRVDDYEMQQGSGLPDAEFKVGLEWLITQNFLDRQEERLH